MRTKRTSATNVTLFAVMALLAASCQSQTVGDDSLLNTLTRNLLSGQPTNAASELTVGEIAEGLKEALRVGTGTVVANLGQRDGFYTDDIAHIPLPENLRRPRDLLRKIGMGQLADDLEERLNRAAEVATPRARAIFWQAIREMRLEDVIGIYRGPDDSATRYFQRKMTPALIAELQPVIERAMSEVGVVRAYDRFAGRYQAIPFVPDLKGDLTRHVLTGTLDGIFYYVAREEAAIRRNPVKRTTAILKRVFGALN